MIAFDLICSNGHLFECWFKDSASFEEQKSSGIINCPVCDDCLVEKVFSPFAIKKNNEARERVEVNTYEFVRTVHEYIEKHFEDVGAEFYKEALKIHYGEAERRNIKGTATPEEEFILKEEGVQFFKVPVIKRMLN